MTAAAVLVAQAAELESYGLTRTQAAERLGVPRNTLDQALARNARRLAASQCQRPGVRRGKLPDFALPKIRGCRVMRNGCGTILALRLHEALGEDPCPVCVANAVDRGVEVRVPQPWYDPVTPAEAARNREILARELRAWDNRNRRLLAEALKARRGR
ncbi:MAG TPA: hypothetical protein VGG54_23155 [Trebonia sp.]|jgi:hypothetical protein